MPAAGDGISTVVLSVWISTSGWSSAISSPSATSQRATSPSVRPSPRSGSLNSYATAAEATCAGRPTRTPAGTIRTRRPSPARQSETACSLAVEVGGHVARHVAGLQRAFVVPDTDRVRVVLVLAARARARAAARDRTTRRRPRRRETRPPRRATTRTRGSSQRDALAGCRVAQVVARAAPVALEPEP